MMNTFAAQRRLFALTNAFLEDLAAKVISFYAASWLKVKLSQDRPFALVWLLNRLCWYYLGHNIVSSTLDLVGRCLFCKWKRTAVLLLGNRIICCWSDYCRLTSALTDCFFSPNSTLAYIVSVYMMDYSKFTVNLGPVYLYLNAQL